MKNDTYRWDIAQLLYILSSWRSREFGEILWIALSILNAHLFHGYTLSEIIHHFYPILFFFIRKITNIIIIRSHYCL
jgi:hypothetical protein